MTFDEFLDRLHAVTGTGNQRTARCPAHQDRQASLSIGLGQDGRVLLHCHAGCTLQQITTALNLTVNDLFTVNDQPAAPWGDMPLGQVETDLLPDPQDLDHAAANLQHNQPALERIFELKGWRASVLAALGIGLRGDRLTIPARTLGGELVNLLRYWPEKHPKMLSLRGHPRTPLYALADPDGPVFLCEGETDAISLAHLGVNAIGAPGASARARVEWLTPTLEGRDVFVIFDADTPGRRAAQRWAAAAQEAGAASVRVIELDGPTGYDVGDLLHEHRADPDHGRRILFDLAAHATPYTPEPAPAFEAPRQLLTGGQLLDLPDTVPAVWGEAHRVAWAVGERLTIVAPQGAGKTTLAQRLALARAGLADHVLGLPVADDGRRVLYVAGDRPAQALRSFRRMLDPHRRQALDDRLLVWKGAPPIDLVADRDSLHQWIVDLDPTIGTVVVDSVKDMAPALSKDEVGSAVDHAFRRVSDTGLELVALHHLRKGQMEKGAASGKPRGLEDVYGSVWLTAGSGSVLLLWGAPGDLVLELSTLKPIADPLGPWTIVVDHEQGTMRVEDQADVLDVLRAAGMDGLTALDAARALGYSGGERAGKERARRELDRLVEQGLAEREDGSKRIAAKWYACTSVQLSVHPAHGTARGARNGSNTEHNPLHGQHNAP